MLAYHKASGDCDIGIKVIPKNIRTRHIKSVCSTRNKVFAKFN